MAYAWRTAVFLAIACAADIPPAIPASEWMLMGRHGGCVSLFDAAQRKEIFGGVSTPDRLIEKFRHEDAATQVNDTVVGGTRVVEITSAKLGLAVVLVPRHLCQKLDGAGSSN